MCSSEARLVQQYWESGTSREFEMAAITCDPSCFELFDDGTNEPESDVSCTSLSAAVATDH